MLRELVVPNSLISCYSINSIKLNYNFIFSMFLNEMSDFENVYHFINKYIALQILAR